MFFSIIAAVDKKYGLGKKRQLAWDLKADMKHFKDTTLQAELGKQNAVIMGSTTWESIPERFRPLQGRINVVLSRRKDFSLPDGVILSGSINDALDSLTGMGVGLNQVFIIGGASVYNEAINHPLCQKIYLTEIQKDYDCDVFFPHINPKLFSKINASEFVEEGSVKFRFVEYEKK